MSDPREYSKDELDNHSNQLNDNNDAYYQSRGEDGRPDDDDDSNEVDYEDDCDDGYKWIHFY